MYECICCRYTTNNCDVLSISLHHVISYSMICMSEKTACVHKKNFASQPGPLDLRGRHSSWKKWGLEHIDLTDERGDPAVSHVLGNRLLDAIAFGAMAEFLQSAREMFKRWLSWSPLNLR